MSSRTPIGRLVEMSGEPWRPEGHPDVIRVTAAEVIRAEMAVHGPERCPWCDEEECPDPQRCADLADHDEATLRAWAEAR